MGKTVLLIEDEPNIIEAIRFILSREGWRVETHQRGDTAMSAIERYQPNVVVLDVMLPNRSGFDILRDIRADATMRDIPVLMLTARGQSHDRELAERYGADRFMTKPFSNTEVLDALNELVSQ